MTYRKYRTLLCSGALVLSSLSLAPLVLAQEQAVPEAPPSDEGVASSGDGAPTEAVEDKATPEEGDDSTEAEDSTEEAAAPAPAEPEVDPYAEAKERVGRAEKLFEDGNFDAALTEFEQAYETMVGHPARNYVLFNIGKCQEKLYRYDAAISSYRTYLLNADDGAEDIEAVKAKIELLEGLLGTLAVNVSSKEGAAPASYEVWVDGRLIDADNNKKFMVPGGNHQVEVRADGFEVQNQEVQIPARSEKALNFALTPLAEEYKGLPQTYFWTATALTGVAAVGGGVFGVLTVTKKSEVNRKESELVTQDDEDALKSRALTADLFFVGAGVFATTAVILAFMTDWSSEATEPGPIQIKEVGLAPTPSGGFLGVKGAF